MCSRFLTSPLNEKPRKLRRGCLQIVPSSEPGMEARGAGGSRERKKAVSKSIKAGLQFPVGCIARFLKKGRYAQRTRTGAPICLAALLEYLAAVRSSEETMGPKDSSEI
ncbi:probable histone H2A.5 [Rhodamnia argentea]|uniref:Histone H2A n=1 Tax=Rhodamnia argentea TaxID=178133 RepID=A0A8B8N4L2_9MYRT|nr:probable histone H2A.5 [Rhodamnia argentea]